MPFSPFLVPPLSLVSRVPQNSLPFFGSQLTSGVFIWKELLMGGLWALELTQDDSPTNFPNLMCPFCVTTPVSLFPGGPSNSRVSLLRAQLGHVN